MTQGFDIDELERLLAHGGAGVVVLDRDDLSAILTEIRELRAENARLRDVPSRILAEACSFTCASCSQLSDCESAFGAPGEVGLGCADWTPSSSALGEPQ